MTKREKPSGMTLQIEVGDTDRARHFYGALFGREPQYEPHDNFLEWKVANSEAWVQAVCVRGLVRPLQNRVRFRVTDVPAVHAELTSALVTVSTISVLAGVVRFFDFADPWGNELGYYEDLAPSGEQPSVGGSVHDKSLFTEDDSIR